LAAPKSAFHIVLFQAGVVENSTPQSDVIPPWPGEPYALSQRKCPEAEIAAADLLAAGGICEEFDVWRAILFHFSMHCRKIKKRHSIVIILNVTNV
uniref:Uncharacterized protein n=1 Tax=Parascaris equorum TaxID=6256 RepID=A0A914S4H6_PAREQ